jgi:hypothetical protein
VPALWASIPQPDPDKQGSDEKSDKEKDKGKSKSDKKSSERNAAQDRLLSDKEIVRLKNAGYDPHDLKPNSRFDHGNLYVKPKGGIGPGEPTGINLNDLNER